ncbi:MAG: pyrroloquinoline quinone biosynthesis protein PqqB [bacterium]|nr:pyrroloquinoline quinone biosynthesis protein PqqB [bacterium]
MNARLRRRLVLVLPLLALGCAAAPRERQANGAPTQQPYVLVLGTAQDGGYPQIACDRPCCAAARAAPWLTRGVVSLLLVDPRSNKRWLFEATPDLRDQLELARGHGGPAPGTAGRPALFDGIFLTHAHIGHYTGLAHLGREAYGGEETSLFGSRRMVDFLTTHGPWSLLFEDRHLTAAPFTPDAPIALAPDLSVTPLRVPHREEFTDAYAFRIDGPSRSALFLPDIDKWERWERAIEDVLAGVDVAWLDGTFFGPDELPGRDMASIPHPFIVESLARFEQLTEEERTKVRFIHLNHSNPATDPASDAGRAIRAAGMGVAREGDVFAL